MEYEEFMTYVQSLAKSDASEEVERAFSNAYEEFFTTSSSISEVPV